MAFEISNGFQLSTFTLASTSKSPNSIKLVSIKLVYWELDGLGNLPTYTNHIKQIPHQLDYTGEKNPMIYFKNKLE
jgi:hypothetical protein